MKKVKAKAVDVTFDLRLPYRVQKFEYGSGNFVAILNSEVGGHALEIQIQDVAGIKLLDEINFSNHWPDCATGRGCLFSIEENGWFDFERTRQDFMSGETAAFHEYFIPSSAECICILAWGEPVVRVLDVR